MTLAALGAYRPAVAIEWTNPAGGPFGDPSNWLGNVVPGANDPADFSLDSAYVVSLATNVTNAALNVHGGAVSLDLGGFTYDGAVNVGQFGADHGRFSIGNGTLRASVVYVGRNVGASGTLTLSDGTLRVSTSEYVGNAGIGTLIQAGGSHTADNLYLGLAAGGTNSSPAAGNFTLGGGSLGVSTSEFVGYSGVGTFTQSGGVHTAANLSLGHLAQTTGGPAARGTYALAGGTLSLAGDVRIGDGGIGSFNQSGGSNILAPAAALFIGYQQGATGPIR
jgi:hypothetical protein